MIRPVMMLLFDTVPYWKSWSSTWNNPTSKHSFNFSEYQLFENVYIPFTSMLETNTTWGPILETRWNLNGPPSFKYCKL
jgi:hypothetical protein